MPHDAAPCRTESRKTPASIGLDLPPWIARLNRGIFSKVVRSCRGRRLHAPFAFEALLARGRTWPLFQMTRPERFEIPTPWFVEGSSQFVGFVLQKLTWPVLTQFSAKSRQVTPNSCSTPRPCPNVADIAVTSCTAWVIVQADAGSNWGQDTRCKSRRSNRINSPPRRSLEIVSSLSIASRYQLPPTPRLVRFRRIQLLLAIDPKV
jgi:hypothetical protein